MRNTLFIAVIFLLATGCHHPAPVTNKPADSTKADTNTASQSQKIAKSFPDVKMVGDTDKVKDDYVARPWVDSLIANYIIHTQNQLVRSAIKNKLNEGRQFDQVITTDTAIYLSYQVGHDVTDKNGSNPRYTTDSWICIDTAKRKLYEMDANHHLIQWRK